MGPQHAGAFPGVCPMSCGSYRPGVLLGVALTVLQTAPRAATTPQEVEQFLLGPAKFAAADVAALEGGTVIARVMPGGTDSEVMTVAAVKIRATPAQVAGYYGQMITYVDGQITTAFGKFSTPPAAADVQNLSLDPDDIAQLKACKPGACDLRVGGAGLATLRASIDWSAPDAAARVDALMRKATIDYVSAYQKSGDAALVTYNDRAEPVSLKEQWRSILAASPVFQQYSPALKTYLEEYPRTLPGATDVLYWVKEKYTGLKPVISIVHGVIYRPPDHPERIVVLQKQLYASHYYDGSLAVASIIAAPEGTAPVTYLLYGNRSRGDLLKGGFGGLKRKVARDQAKKSAEQTLETIKSVLERPSPAAR
jgi:hypothetical protein